MATATRHDHTHCKWSIGWSSCSWCYIGRVSLQETVPASCIWEYRTSCKPPQFGWKELRLLVTASYRCHFIHLVHVLVSVAGKTNTLETFTTMSTCWVYLSQEKTEKSASSSKHMKHCMWTPFWNDRWRNTLSREQLWSRDLFTCTECNMNSYYYSWSCPVACSGYFPKYIHTHALKAVLPKPKIFYMYHYSLSMYHAEFSSLLYLVNFQNSLSSSLVKQIHLVCFAFTARIHVASDNWWHGT